MVRLGKRCIIVFSVVYAVDGIVMMALGATRLSHLTPALSVMDEVMQPLSVVSLLIGLPLLLVSLVGLWGALKRIRSFLLVYAWSLGALVVVQYLTAVIAYPCRSYTADALRKGLARLFGCYLEPSCRRTFDDIQRSFQCCGLTTEYDWLNKGLSVPASCIDTDCTSVDCSGNWSHGCYDKVSSGLDYWYYSMATLIFVSGFIQKLGVRAAIYEIQKIGVTVR